VKFPEPGRVKTRLAAGIGDVDAAWAYRAMVECTKAALLALDPSRFAVFFHCDPFWPLDDYRPWLDPPAHLTLRPQSEGDLGQRLLAAARGLLAEYPTAILVGTDCPPLRTAHLEEAAAKLSRGADLVIGPATDGGYYLVGLRHPHAGLFEGIAWSTKYVLSQTLEKARAAGLRVSLLEELTDVDTVEDWEALRKFRT